MDKIVTPDCPECHGEGDVPMRPGDTLNLLSRRHCHTCMQRWDDANPLPEQPTVAESLSPTLDALFEKLERMKTENPDSAFSRAERSREELARLRNMAEKIRVVRESLLEWSGPPCGCSEHCDGWSDGFDAARKSFLADINDALAFLKL